MNSYRLIFVDGTEQFIENTVLDPIHILLTNSDVINIYVYDEFGIQTDFYETI